MDHRASGGGTLSGETGWREAQGVLLWPHIKGMAAPPGTGSAPGPAGRADLLLPGGHEKARGTDPVAAIPSTGSGWFPDRDPEQLLGKDDFTRLWRWLVPLSRPHSPALRAWKSAPHPCARLPPTPAPTPHATSSIGCDGRGAGMRVLPLSWEISFVSSTSSPSCRVCVTGARAPCGGFTWSEPLGVMAALHRPPVPSPAQVPRSQHGEQMETTEPWPAGGSCIGAKVGASLRHGATAGEGGHLGLQTLGHGPTARRPGGQDTPGGAPRDGAAGRGPRGRGPSVGRNDEAAQ